MISNKIFFTHKDVKNILVGKDISWSDNLIKGLKSIEKDYVLLMIDDLILNKKISNKFTRTYCNTTKFGISYDGALAFAIGETNKEFKNNKLNKFIDYSLLKNSIVNDLENNCQVYDFAISKLENLKFN